MQDLYQRLGSQGFDAKFLKRVVLPDWWDDKLAAEPANRALAEAAISKTLGFKIEQLRDAAKSLPNPPVGNFRFKRHKDVPATEVRPALFVAQRLAATVTSLVSRGGTLPTFSATVTADHVRAKVLARHASVDLPALLEFAWNCGIIVIHVRPDRLPKTSKKFAGIAMFCEEIPVVILGSGKDSPPWLAFHLAHELGHLLLRHVKAGDSPLVDSDIDSVDNDTQEKQADAFANKVLTGSETPGFQPEYGLTAPKLAASAQRWGKARGVDAGTVALIYARSANRWGPAQLALKRLGANAGAHRIIGQALAERIDLDELPDSTARFLTCLSVDGAACE